MVRKFEKLFFGIEMKWWKVLAFAVISGIFTGVIMLFPALEITSIHNIGVTYEAWILFALVIILNCNKAWEASLKTFVYFLVSQPIIYLVQWNKFHGIPWNYYRFWLVLTVLTLPGAFIAWQVKRKNLLGALVLSVATSFLGFFATDLLIDIIRAGGFPWGILTVLFCYAEIIVFTFTFMDKAKLKMIVAAVTVAATLILCFMFSRNMVSSADYPVDGITPSTHCYGYDESIISVTPYEDKIDVAAHKKGETTVICENEDGSRYVYNITVDGKGTITFHETESDE